MGCREVIALTEDVKTQIRLLNSQSRTLFGRLWYHTYTYIYIRVSDHHFASKLIPLPVTMIMVNRTIYPVVGFLNFYILILE